jgi:transcriptional regulator with XRE-family HTH domain
MQLHGHTQRDESLSRSNTRTFGREMMAGPQSPIGSRRRLGAELRRLRNKSGLTLDEVAERMTCSTSKISRLETGKGLPKVPDVSELMRIYGVASDTERDMLLRLVHDGREHGWWESYTEGVQPERYVLDVPGRYPSLENDARAVRSFDLTVVHGLLQTEDYSRAVIEPVLPHHSAEEIDRLVALRQRRQAAIGRRSPRPLEMVALIDEVVLQRPVGGATVMAAQLDWLLEAGRLPNVTIQVLPLVVGILRAHAGHFVLLDIPAELGSDVVYIEGHAGDSFLDTEPDVQLYYEVFADALASSLSPAESADVITRYRARHTPH